MEGVSAAPPVPCTTALPACVFRATILFSTASTASLQLPARLMGYVTAFRALQPHRLLPVSDMPAEAILNEPLFFNQQIPVPLSRSATSGASGSMGSKPFTPQDQPLLLAAGLTKGPLYGPDHLSLGVWGRGQQPGHQLVVRQASQRLRLIQARKHGILAPGSLTCQPRLLPSLGSDLTPAEVLQALESRWTASMQASPASRARLSSDMPTSQPAWMALTRGHRQHWSQRQQQQQAQQQQQPSQQPNQPHSGRATIHDTVDVLAPPGRHPQLSEWRRLWQLASAAYFNRQHRVLWWRILHGCVMCGAFSAYIGRATVEQACCPYACCSSPAQPQTISHMFLECPMAATVISWLCRLWQAMTGHLPDASVATILAASTSEGQCASDALLQTWHRLRLAVLHSIWTAARIAASSTHASSQASQSSSQSHLASRLALKTVTSMIHQDWVKCNDDVRQLAGVIKE
ncbi:hypothetical protein ABBQ38_013698 [Trebouxia sp. C0009 RCD-2024]